MPELAHVLQVAKRDTKTRIQRWTALRQAKARLSRPVGGRPYRRAKGDRGTTVRPTIHDLLPEERESLVRIMGVVNCLTDEERDHLIRNVYISVLCYRRERNPDVLDILARDLLGTARLHASPAYRKGVASATPPDLERPAIAVKELLDALPDRH